MMKMQAKLLMVSCIAGLGSIGYGQYAAESMAAINMNNNIQGQMPGAPPPVPGGVPGVGNPGAGFAAPGMGGNTAQGMDPAVMGDPTLGGGAGLSGQPGAVFTPAAAPPIPTENVWTGRRVYDAVSGGLLEDAIEIAVRQTDVDAYPDDGVRDNGIAGDGIRGNVDTSQGQYIGQFSNTVKTQLIHAVRNAETIDPMIYYGYHVAKLEPQVEGMKRYGLPLPGETDETLVSKVVLDLPNVLDLETDRDELVRRWNHEFLAEYRVVPEDPQSEYFPVFVPAPPLTPGNYPVPNGYVSPQSVALAQTSKAQQDEAAAAAAVASQKAASRGAGAGAGADPGAGGGI